MLYVSGLVVTYEEMSVPTVDNTWVGLLLKNLFGFLVNKNWHILGGKALYHRAGHLPIIEYPLRSGVLE